MTQQTKQRPFVVTILAILAGIVGVMSVIHALQGLGILPFIIGSFKFVASGKRACSSYSLFVGEVVTVHTLWSTATASQFTTSPPVWIRTE